MSAGFTLPMNIHILKRFLDITDVIIRGGLGGLWIAIQYRIHQMIVLVAKMLKVISPLVQVLENRLRITWTSTTLCEASPTAR